MGFNHTYEIIRNNCKKIFTDSHVEYFLEAHDTLIVVDTKLKVIRRYLPELTGELEKFEKNFKNREVSSILSYYLSFKDIVKVLNSR